jgi:hypothetical protein
MKFAALCIAFLLAVSCATDGQSNQPARVSLVQLIANPEKYDGQLVSAVGFLTMGEEGTGLWLHETDFLNGIDADAISVDRTKEMYSDKEHLNLNYMLIEGIFRNEKKLAAYPQTGRITKVQRCDLWSQPNNPRAKRQTRAGH